MHRFAVVRVLLLALVAGIAVVYVGAGARHPWDFETYYHAASAYRVGLDPYQLQSLTSVAGRPVELPFLYPPATLLLFVPFSHLPLGAAIVAWLTIQCLLAGILLWIWWRTFLRSVAPDLLVVVALLGFDVALLWNLRTGNVALAEQVLLWAGLAAYVRGRHSIAAVLIGLASIFKLYPIAFLAIFLTAPGRRERLIPIGLGLAVFISVIAIPIVTLESWAHALAVGLRQAHPIPNADPSAPTILEWAIALAGIPSPAARLVRAALYSLFVIVVLSSVIAHKRMRWAFGPVDHVVTAVILWLLLSPRVMVYSYTSAVVPSLFAIHQAIRRRAWRVAACALLLLQGFVRFLPGPPPIWLGTVSFLIMLATWVLWIRSREAGPTVRSVEPSAAPV